EDCLQVRIIRHHARRRGDTAAPWRVRRGGGMTTPVFESRMDQWTLGAPPPGYVLGHVRAVLADRVLEDALVAVRDGVVAAVEPHAPGVEADVDGQGLLCIPGLVDVHSD